MNGWTFTAPAGIPADGMPHEITVRVSSEDHPGAVALAVNLPAAVEAYRNYRDLPELTGVQLYSVLLQVAKIRELASSLEDELIFQMRDKGASWSVIGGALGVHRSTAKERYARIARSRELGVSVDEFKRLEANVVPIVMDFRPENGPVERVYADVTMSMLADIKTAIREAPDAVISLSCRLDHPDEPLHSLVFRAGRLTIVEG